MNNPFDEFMQKHDMDQLETQNRLITRLQNLVEDLANEFEKKLIFGAMREAGMDETAIHALDLLIKNGCPIEAIAQTFMDIAKEHEEDSKDE